MKIYKVQIVTFLASEICLLFGIVFLYYSGEDFEGEFLVCSIGFAIASIISGGICLISAMQIYREKHSEKDNVYRVNLVSITPKITVYTDWSKERNIRNADIQKVDTILVQKTGVNTYCKEIITGNLIPVSIVEYEPIEGKSYFNFTSPLFVYWVLVYNSKMDVFLEDKNNSYEYATLDEVEQYVQERKNGYKGYPSFKKYLEHLYEQAEGYYKTAKQNEISGKKKLQKILKTAKQKTK